MFDEIKNFFLSFFPRRLRRQVRELYSCSVILIFAESLFTIFEPVFIYAIFIKLYDLQGTLEVVLFFYLLIYILYLLAMPLGARLAKKIGYENSIALSVVATIALYFCFYAMEHYLWPAFFGAAFFYALAKLFFWPAYHADFARFSRDGQQGREISNLLALETAVAIVAPLIGGLILKFFGFNTLFVVSSILMIISLVPMLATKEKILPSTAFTYRDALTRLLAPQNRRRFWAVFGFGEELIALVIWPIFIFVVVNDLLGLGALAAASTALTALVFVVVGRISDKKDRRVVVRYGTIFYFLSWLVRLATRSVFGVFVVDVYSRVAKQAISVPITAATYEEAQDSSVMGTIVFFEMSLVIGKIAAMILALVLLQLFVPGWNAMFILAGMFTLFYLLF